METQKINEDLVGEEFIAFSFPNRTQLQYTSEYVKAEGCKAEVININNSWPEYANCLVTYHDETINHLHYPSDLIRKQIEEKEVDIDILFEQFKNIIH